MKQTILKQGTFRKSNTGTETASELNLDKWFKRFSKKLGISFNDPCCDDPVNLPVSIDANGNLMSFNPVTGDWTTINSVARVDPAITALGTSDTDGYALTKELSIITGGAANTGVELPSAAVGLEFTVVNLTATAKKVYATTGDAIDDKTVTTGFVTLQPEDVVVFRAYTNALWQSDFEAEAAYTSVSTDTISEFTAASGVTVDSALIKDGSLQYNDGATVHIAGMIPNTGIDSLSGAGVVSASKYLTNYTSTGAAQALTLAAGNVVGQLKKVKHIVDGGSGVLTPSALEGGTTITFTTVGETAVLMWNGTKWRAIELSNSSTPGTLPVLA